MVKNEIYFYQYSAVEIVEGKGMPKFPYHTHESLLIGVIKSGEALFTIGNNSYTLREGDTYLVPPGTGLSITPVSTYHYITICIKGIYKERLRHPAGIIPGISTKILGSCDRLNVNRDSNMFLADLAEILNSSPADSTAGSIDSCLISEVKNYIHTHLNDNISLDDISKGIHISKYHLLRSFREKTGITPKQYLLQSRLRLAKADILGGKAVKEIAYDLNFSAQSHLCTIFKKYMGISIKDYKNSIRIIEQ